MRSLLIDENLPPRLAKLFNDHGIAARHIFEVSSPGASDGKIWSLARLTGAAIATKDEDFLESVFLRPTACVLYFSVGNLKARDLLDFAESHFEEIRTFLQGHDRVLVLRNRRS